MPDFAMPPLNPALMQAIERLQYRVTVGDVATQAGLDLATTEQGLLVLASQAGGHLQVAESGDLVYKFPDNFREILRNKFWQLRLKEGWEKTWQVLFYLIRVGFGLSLLVLLLLVMIGVIVAMMSMKSSDSDRRDDRDTDFNVGMWFDPSIFWLFDFSSFGSGQRRYREGGRPSNFLEAVFSFVFGDGDPNRDLEDRRWQAIGQVLRQHRGAVVAEQVAPYLDDLGSGFSREYEEFMLPVLVRFGGSPEVSPEGHLAYRFPDLQKTAGANAPRSLRPPIPFLQEELWRFSTADGSLLMWAGGLGVLLLVLSLFLMGLLPGAVSIAGIFRPIAYAAFAYSLFYLGVPTVRSLVISSKNAKIAARNRDRQLRAEQLEARDSTLQQKLAFAQQFAQEARIDEADLTYTTERDLLDQEIEQRDRLDAEWEKRLTDRQTDR